MMCVREMPCGRPALVPERDGDGRGAGPRVITPERATSGGRMDVRRFRAGIRGRGADRNPLWYSLFRGAGRITAREDLKMLEKEPRSYQCRTNIELSLRDRIIEYQEYCGIVSFSLAVRELLMKALAAEGVSDISVDEILGLLRKYESLSAIPKEAILNMLSSNGIQVPA